jgi:predicted ATP-dependent endonuclease of OLD family
MVGYNNAGKSNILEAINWFLNPSGLDETCFNDMERSIEVDGMIKGVTTELIEKIEEKHRNRIEPFVNDKRILFKRTQSEPGGKASLRDLFVRNFDEEEESEQAWVKNPTGIDNAITKLFPEPILVPAMDDANEDIAKYKTTTTIGKLISEILKPIEEERKDEINKVLDGLRERFEADGENRTKELEDFDKEANLKIGDFFPGVEINVHIPTPEIKELFKSGTVKIKEEGSDILRNFDSLGHGAQRSIQMALIRQLAESNKDSEDVGRTLLLIEEPELFLHPQGIWRLKTALKELSNKNYQIIITTHSPLMLNKNDIPKTLLIRKNVEEGTYRLKSILEAVEGKIEDHNSQADLLFELGNSSKILFSEKIILLEGKSEAETIPLMYELLSDEAAKKSKIAFIPLRGSGDILNSMEILNEMKFNVKAVADLDFCFQKASKNGLLEDDDKDIEACKNLFEELHEELEIELSKDGLPKKNKGKNTSAEEAYEKLADQEALQPHFHNLFEKLKEQKIWTWKTGAIEKPFGIASKTDNARNNFIKEVNRSENCLDCVADRDLVEDFFDWIDEQD